MTNVKTKTSGSGQGHLLAENGKTTYVIVVADGASASTKYATEELKRFLGEMSGVEFPVTNDAKPVGPAEIVIGDNAHSKTLMPKLSFDKLGKEEFVIRSVGKHLLIAGGEPRGTLYGVYQLLGDLGCRWFTRDVARVPKRDKLVAPSYEFTAEPALEYREPFFREAFDPPWAARNRVNSSHSDLAKQYGGKVRYGKGAFVHTFDPLVPVAKYFATHPEYYSLIDGKRTDDHTQLCLTNPDVLKLVIEGVRKWIREDPEATIFSVSQNDWYNPCQCDNCRAIDEREGSHSGTMLWFVNQVADAIADESPHVAIDTLAYQFTRKPPKTLRPRPNVIVRLCSIECCFAHPLESCPENATFADDIRGWSKICDRLYVWDYVTNFRSYLLPWPNFGVLGPNVRFYAKHNVVGLFEQGSYSSGGGGELAELRAYVLAKLLWNPDTDQRTIENEFIEGVYGKAAKLIRQYVDLIHEPVKDPNAHMHIFCDVDNPHIVDDVIARGDALLDEAESVAESTEVLERIEKAHLPIWYVRIRKMADDDPARKPLLDRFVAVAKRNGIVEMGEARPLDRWVETGARDPVTR